MTACTGNAHTRVRNLLPNCKHANIEYSGCVYRQQTTDASISLARAYPDRRACGSNERVDVQYR